MCSFTKKLKLLWDEVPQTPYRGSAPGPRWGTSPRPQSSFVSPNNPVRSMLLSISASDSLFCDIQRQLNKFMLID